MIDNFGRRVWNATTGESGIVVGNTQRGDLRIQVDVDPDEWKASVIGPPSLVAAVWKRWNVTRFEPTNLLGEARYH